MEKLLHTLLVCFVFASCAHEEETSEAKEWFDSHYNYPVYINIEKDSLSSSIVSTDVVQCGDIKAKTKFAGVAKELIEMSEDMYINSLDNYISKNGLPKNDNFLCILYFKDTCIKVEITRDNNFIEVK